MTFCNEENTNDIFMDTFEFIDDDGLKKSVKYDKYTYPYDHQPLDEVRENVLKDIKNGWWGKPTIVE